MCLPPLLCVRQADLPRYTSLVPGLLYICISSYGCTCLLPSGRSKRSEIRRLWTIVSLRKQLAYSDKNNSHIIFCNNHQKVVGPIPHLPYCLGWPCLTGIWERGHLLAFPNFGLFCSKCCIPPSVSLIYPVLVTYACGNTMYKPVITHYLQGKKSSKHTWPGNDIPIFQGNA